MIVFFKLFFYILFVIDGNLKENMINFKKLFFKGQFWIYLAHVIFSVSLYEIHRITLSMFTPLKFLIY